jgi:hypothetical protein
MHDRTIAFLLGNMKEMEIELRAQSITFEALGQGIVDVRDLQDSLHMARESEAMLAFVDRKYQQLRELLPLTTDAPADDEIAKLVGKSKSASLLQ